MRISLNKRWELVSSFLFYKYKWLQFKYLFNQYKYIFDKIKQNKISENQGRNKNLIL